MYPNNIVEQIQKIVDQDSKKGQDSKSRDNSASMYIETLKSFVETFLRLFEISKDNGFYAFFI